MRRKYKGKKSVPDWMKEFSTFSTLVCASFFQRGDVGTELKLSDYNVISYLCELVGIDEVALKTGYDRHEIRDLHEEVKRLNPLFARRLEE